MTLLSLLGVATCHGQYLKGAITNKEDVDGIHIINLNTRISTITNSFGNFEVPAVLADTLLVSSIHYMPEKIVVTQPMIDIGAVVITLTAQVNQLDEVLLGHDLTGDVRRDSKKIPTKKPLNFDDVGIPGFLGEPEEKIVPIVPTIGLVTAVDLEVLYKHLSGYYKTLRTKRKWEAQNQLVARIINAYGASFFEEAYGIPENRLYDFILFCMETSPLQRDYKTENFAGVLQSFQQNGAEYLTRLREGETATREKKE